MSEYESGGGEDFEAWDAQLHESDLETALKALRKKFDNGKFTGEEPPIRKGKKLIQAEISDLSEVRSTQSSEVQDLRKLDAALSQIESGNYHELRYEDIRLVHDHFREKKNGLQSTMSQLPLDDASLTELYLTWSIYHAILADINTHLPTPEALLPQYPTYDLANLNTLLAEYVNTFQKKGGKPKKITINDILPFYQAFAADVKAKKEKAENEDADSESQWTKQRQLIEDVNKTDLWKGITTGKRPTLLVTHDGEGKVEKVEAVEETDHPPQSIEGKTQYIIFDPDDEYYTGILAFNTLAAISSEGLQAFKQSDPSAQASAVFSLQQLIEQGIRRGKIDKKYASIVGTLNTFFRTLVSRKMLDL